MSMFWTIWISVITLGSILGCYVLLRWCLSNSTGVKEGESMGHVFDGIEEMNNQLPRWWTILFYICIVWGVAYLLLYPGLGGYKGLLGWESSNQGVLSLEESKLALQKDIEDGNWNEYALQIKYANEKFDPIFAEYAKTPVEQLAKNEEAVQVGQRLFLQNCAQCHGSNAKGAASGFPNLTDNDWIYGGSGDKIKETLILGRRGAMPGWLNSMGEDGVAEVVAYTLSLSGRDVDQGLKEAGKARFVVCAACHGMDGKGNQMIGAPNLTDNIWLYGGNQKTVTETLYYGRNGVMPAFKETLGEDKVHVVAAYVYSLSQIK
ncbi:cytochrome-c oxidase, cbb3-type subunit III [Brumicola nitratireducens]|uniref:Cbb3-type cytochrome c oxidase subunit n=1 Tax=Glaciecola nitratireducens (strain JCM 12485 / KCTC 12276 / FR1064) TaxID=1085623 RepID=G4QHF5_GLANF|nr:cytochrome-c oxidase, cbb3-type subunit III [Glaciecola nitratireducens]AEP29941.1 cytochrome c oxidase, cbb3-type, subunit III [Glaciecola nitratireducens FR1064]